MMRARTALAVAVVALAAGCAGPARQVQVAAPDRNAVPAAAPAPELKVPPQKHFQLTNHLKVRLVEDHRLPIVAMTLVVDGGALHDPTSAPGLASFTASMVTEGTKSRSATQISDALGFIGATLSAGAGFDAATLSGSSLSNHLDELLDLLADVTENPTFPQADFARVQDERIVALVQQRDVPGAVAAKAFAHAFWGAHPYGHWAMGNEASVKAMTRDDLARFHAQYWRPERSELVVVGDVSESELRDKVTKALGSWLAGTAPKEVAAAPPAGGLRTVLIDKAGAPQAFVMMGMPGLDRKSPDYVAGEVAFQVLGGGTASRLFRDLREKHGYTYGIYSRAEARKLGGASLIVGSVRADVTGAAVRELLAEIASVRDAPVTPAELEDARSSIVLGLPAEFATASGVASKLGEEAIYGLPDDYWDRYADAVKKVSAGEVQAVAKRYLDPAKLTTVMVCETAEVKPQLDGLAIGPVEVRPGPTAETAPRAKGAAGAR